MPTARCSGTERIKSKSFSHPAKGFGPQYRELGTPAQLQFVPLVPAQNQPAKRAFLLLLLESQAACYRTAALLAREQHLHRLMLPLK